MDGSLAGAGMADGGAMDGDVAGGGVAGTWMAGAVCTIVADHETGVMKGGADPRRPSYALGV